MLERPTLLLLAILVLFPLSVLQAGSGAQRSRCGTREPDPSGVTPVPSDCGYLTNSPQEEYEPSCTYEVRVVFHVIQNTSGSGYLSPETIQDQIDVLNEDFQALPGSPGAPGTNARIRFRLATEDPDGQPTTGITYSTNNTWFQDNGSYWNSLAWDTNRYMNIYTNAVPCCYGYVSDFPSQGVAGQVDDRVVLWWEAVGKQPTSGWPLNMGRTATHEAGHYLGLYHTFCGGCGSATDCYGTADLICDTNREQNPTFGCPGSKTSCGSPDPIHNYMDYTDDPCLWEFTPEQVNRMRCTLVHWRPDVYTTSSTSIGEPYCTAAPNSAGPGSLLSASGDASVAANDLALTASGAPAGFFGLFYYGSGTTQVPFGDGVRCVEAPFFRLDPPAPIDASGTAQRLLDLTQPPLAGGAGQVSAGSTWNFQFWYRDPLGPGGTGFNLSNGLAVSFCP